MGRWPLTRPVRHAPLSSVSIWFLFKVDEVYGRLSPGNRAVGAAAPREEAPPSPALNIWFHSCSLKLVWILIPNPSGGGTEAFQRFIVCTRLWPRRGCQRTAGSQPRLAERREQSGAWLPAPAPVKCTPRPGLATDTRPDPREIRAPLTAIRRPLPRLFPASSGLCPWCRAPSAPCSAPGDRGIFGLKSFFFFNNFWFFGFFLSSQTFCVWFFFVCLFFGFFHFCHFSIYSKKR